MTMTEQQLAAKRAREVSTVRTMVAIYCHGNHGTRGRELCDECRALADYAAARAERCPVMATKTFCSSCEVHCYAPEQRERIRQVMRYAGPRMLWHDPAGAVRHALDTASAARRKRKQGEGKASR